MNTAKEEIKCHDAKGNKVCFSEIPVKQPEQQRDND